MKMFRRMFQMALLLTLAASLISAPAHARSKKKGGADSTRTAARASAPAAKAPPARDAKGHYIKGGAAPAPATTPAPAAAPASAAPAARAMPARDAKGHFIKGGSAPAPAAPASAAASAPAPARSAPSAMTSAPAPGTGQVWVNLDTKVYHKAGTRWYGKTKHGQYMNEGEAVRAGYRASK